MKPQAVDDRTDYFAMVVEGTITLDLAEQLAAYRCTRCKMGLHCPGRVRWEAVAEKLRKKRS